MSESKKHRKVGLAALRAGNDPYLELPVRLVSTPARRYRPPTQASAPEVAAPLEPRHPNPWR